MNEVRILVVDDEPVTRMITESVLAAQGFIVEAAESAEMALDMLAEGFVPQVILLDVIMPGMDGYEVCRRLRDDMQTRDIPVMFITAQNEETDEAKGLSLGAQDYITKPFRSSLVRNRVANQLKYKRYRDHLNDMVHERTRQLALTQEATIHAMASLAEWRDTETGAHIKRTQNYVKALAVYIAQLPKYREALDTDAISWLYLSAPLHDVGKVAIADTVLHKPGPLTDEEYEAMKEHTTLGRAVLASADKFLGENSFLRIASDIAYCHHERWDGKGYPRGVAGKDIPLSARLMSVADVYDALRSKRVYKPAMPHETAVRIIVDGKGSQFDPDVVDAFVALQEQFRSIAEKYSDA